MPFALFYIFIGWILLETYGHYDGAFILILIAGYSLTILGTALQKRFDKTALWKILFSIAVLYFCASLWKSPGLLYPASAEKLSLLKQLLGLIFGVAAIVVALAWFSTQTFHSWMRAAFWAAVLLLIAARVLTLFVSPDPYIDVFTLTSRASDYLLSGLNPYTQTYADLYNGGYDYAPGLNYWPAYYLWSVPFRLLGDIRLGNIVAEFVTTVLLLKVMPRFDVAESLQYLVVLSWLAFPVSLFVLEQAWIEPVIVMLMAGLIWSALTKKWVLAGMVLGVLSGMKQHLLLLAVLTLFYFWRTCARREFYKASGWAAAAFTVTVAPFLIVSGQAFVQQTLATYFQREMRLDSLSLIAYLANQHDFTANNQLLITIYLLALLVSLALIVRRKPITWQHWSLALFISYGVLFLFGKQAFCNYYYLLAFVALLAQLTSDTTPAGQTPRRPSGFAECAPRRE